MSEFIVPEWAGKPPIGFHLDVMKENKLIQKLMIDGKGCYLFGRNSQLNDFGVEHSSCSRVHAALVYHKHLGRFFLIDCGSTHGTFIGNIRIEANKATQLSAESKFRLGASTRTYQIRERPQIGSTHKNEPEEQPMYEYTNMNNEKAYNGTLLGLPQTESELDSLTEYNTARNRQSIGLNISDIEKTCQSLKQKSTKVNFQINEIIINPEDVDPTVGKFQNMIETKFIPNIDNSYYGIRSGSNKHEYNSLALSATNSKYMLTSRQLLTPTKGLYEELEVSCEANGPSLSASSLAPKLGFSLPNPAPDVCNLQTPGSTQNTNNDDNRESNKKKYPIEAWPGKNTLVKLQRVS